ncbi:MAG: GTP cyclohydrolase II [Anaerolineae bacterium]|nr:GTP cyclohydrolase II [Anaerolineae bacterium]MDK1082021.1 GTP cyclohydrolase II [Anaerolineae bacterium]MDK1118845.1 GTP cyclohydrolase II [Anaerolineae bacterium]
MTTFTHGFLEELIEENRNHKCDGIGRHKVCVRLEAVAELPSRFGDFHIVAFWNNRDEKDHAAIVKGEIIAAENVPVRMHSECLTGDVIGSLRCDCRDQLEAGLNMIGQMDNGIVLYLRQEGRGIGLVNKIRAYSLQDQGLDTVEANIALGFRDDERDYAIAAHMLDSLKVKSINLITNNPNKIEQLTQYGVKVTDRIPHVMEPNKHNRFYLETKAAKSGHFIDFSGKPRLAEQADRPIIAGMSEEQIKAIEEHE